MPAFGITPVGVFPPASGDGFPRFLQFQFNGEDIGDTSVETVNFTGEVVLTLGSGGNVLQVQIGLPPFAWVDIPGDYTLTADDAGNGIATIDHSAVQTITIPNDLDAEIDPGAAVLVYQEGEAQVQFVPASGVLLRYRAETFNPASAGQYATLTLLKRAANEWVLCGDMELA